MRLRAWLAAASAVLAGAVSFAPAPRAETTTFVQGRLVSELGVPGVGGAVTFHSGAASATTVAPGGFFVIDGVVPGSRDRLVVLGSALEDFLGPTFFAGVKPVVDVPLLGAETSSFSDWVTALDPDGTVDDDVNGIFGIVRDASDGPVTGATVTLSPPGPSVVYFDAAGDPDEDATATSANGQFLILDVPPGDVVVTASDGGSTIGVAYGRTVASRVSGLSTDPPVNLSGTALDESGVAVSSAAVSWEFDPSHTAITAGDGTFTLDGLARRLDLELTGVATGYRDALSFRQGLDEIGDASSVEVRFLSEAAYAAYPAALGIVQFPSLGMIVGRVLTTGGTPAAGAVVLVEPSVGTVRYFDAAGAPDPVLTATSSSGRFIVLNVPTGLVTLTPTAPGESILGAVAPSVAGAVTQGDLRGLPTIEVHGRVRDELLQTNGIAAAVVSVVEFPFLATIAASNGDYALAGVPADELVTLKVSRSGFKDSYSFLERMGSEDLDCTGDGDMDGTADRIGCRDLFAISDIGYSNIYSQARQTANRTLSLVGAEMRLSNGLGPVGFGAELTPASGTPRYIPDERFGNKFITTLGSVQFLNASPGTSGLVIADPRTDTSQLFLLRAFPDSVTLTSGERLDCDTDADGTLTNIVPCDGAAVAISAKDLFFQWRPRICNSESCPDEGPGPTVKFQVQISTEPSFATIPITSATSNGKFLKQTIWQAKSSVMKKIRKLRPTETTGDFPIYWRVLGLDDEKREVTSAPFTLILR